MHTILAIDDDASDAEILRRCLEQTLKPGFEFLHFANPAEGLAQLRSRKDIDLTVLDNQLGTLTGLDVVKSIRAGGDVRPVIILAGNGNESIAANLIRNGADDYVVKSDLSPDVLRCAIENAQAQQKRRECEVGGGTHQNESAKSGDAKSQVVMARSVNLPWAEIQQMLDTIDAASEAQTHCNRRSARRAYRSADVRVTVLDAHDKPIWSVKAVTRNISAHGIAFLNKQMMTRGQKLILELPLPDKKYFKVLGRVARCRYISNMVHEVGVEFTGFVD